MEKNGTKVSGIPENETLWEKTKRKAKTACEWGKTHWKGLAVGAIAIGGGAYMLSRRGERDDGETGQTEYSTLRSGETVREAIDRTFSDEEDGSDVGPEDDEPDTDEY